MAKERFERTIPGGACRLLPEGSCTTQHSGDDLQIDASTASRLRSRKLMCKVHQNQNLTVALDAAGGGILGGSPRFGATDKNKSQSDIETATDTAPHSFEQQLAQPKPE